jgi:hypothetical protein
MGDRMITKLTSAIAAVCPIHGVSIGSKDDKATWRIDFKDEATEPQRTSAQGVVDAFDVNAVPTPDELAEQAVSRIDRFRFEMDFAIENRVRVLEGKAPITRTVYLNALKAAWKAMP